MKILQRKAGILILLALIIVPGLSLAQDNTTITVAGSAVAAPVFEALAAASGADVTLNTTVTGTSAGFQAFCQGQADITNATRTITTDEDSVCQASGVDYEELLIAHDILAFIVNPDAGAAECLTSANLKTIFAPSSEGQIANWNQVSPANPDSALTLLVPVETSPEFAILDSIVEGDGIRRDVTVLDSEQAIVETVSQTSGALGVVRLSSATAAGDGVTILPINTNDAVGCVIPSAENVESRLYGATMPLFTYVNRGSLSKPGMEAFVTYIASDQAASAINEAGFTAPSAKAYETNQSIIAGTAEGRQFSLTSAAYEIPANVSGQVTISGSSNAREYITNVTTAFNTQYQGVTFTTKLEGQPEGVRSLCNGNLDIAVTEAGLSPEDAQNCEANNIKTLAIDLGRQAVVLVGNGNSDYLACLTTDQLATIWKAESAKTVTIWNQVDSSFPETPMTLFAPQEGDASTDLLLWRTTGSNDPGRNDANVSSDPLYRAAATANVEGALTYMSWPEYQRVLANNQERIQLVNVDAGDGCIAPDASTIADGTYPLTRSAQLVVSQNALTRPEVQSFLWYLASDQNYPQFEQAGLIGVSFGALPALRDSLQQGFEDAAAAALEATPEPGAEATAEATSEATPETTPDS